MTNLKNDVLSILNKHSATDLHVAPNIPIAKLDNAIVHFPIPLNETVLGLIDCTVFGSCKVGMAITLNGLIWKNDWTATSLKTALTWPELIANEQAIGVDLFNVTLGQGINFKVAGSSVGATTVARVLREIVHQISADKPPQTETKKQQHSELPQYIRANFALIGMFAKLVKSDGAITRNEISFIEDYLEHFAKNNNVEKKELFTFFNTIKNSDKSIYHFAKIVKNETNRDDCLFAYKALWALSLADDELSPIKAAILEDIVPYLPSSNSDSGNLNSPPPTEFNTVAGLLTRTQAPNRDSAVTLNGQVLFKGDDARWQYPLHLFKFANNRDVMLVTSSGGRGTSCESLFFFLVIDQSGITHTPEFGSCSAQGSYVQEGDKITMTIPKMGGNSTYVFDGNTVTEDGVVVTLQADNNPAS